MESEIQKRDTFYSKGQSTGTYGGGTFVETIDDHEHDQNQDQSKVNEDEY